MRFLVLMVLFSYASSAFAQADLRKQLQTKLILAEDGDTILLDSGKIELDATLSLEGKKNITLRGKGMGRTVLSFQQQKSGAEGLRVSNCEAVTLEDFSIEDAKGDCIKVMNVKGISFRNVWAGWTGKPKSSNGSYALYPVGCEQVLVEGCTARGASDAGIYVGQSKHIIVRRNTATENVAGIEIENSLHAEVYDNEVFDNTGGILVFDLPDLPMKRGGHCKVYRNNIHENNRSNFAPKGNIVGKVPRGTGILILAANNVNVFENKVLNHRTMGTGIVSYYITETPIRDSGYYPYPTAISVHHNEYRREKKKAPMEGRMGKLYRFKLKFGKNLPDIVYDGIRDSSLIHASGQYPDHLRICIYDNDQAVSADLDAANGFKKITRNPAFFTCSLKAGGD